MLATGPSKPIGPPIQRIDTERFYLRTLRPTDASERWLRWLADPEVMHPVNTPTRHISLDQLRAHIANHDQMKRLYIGIFDRTNDLHIGFYRIDLDQRHRLATFNLIIGDKDYWGRKVVNETRAALLDYLFRKRNVAKAVGMPPVRNFPSVFNYREQGWRLEGILKSHREGLGGNNRIDQLQFGLTKEEWIELRGKRRS
jgi:RimJ/RimL family protein N-acetyltransferase